MTGWDIKQKSPNGLFRPGAPREITRKYTSTGRTPVLSRLHPTGCLCPPGNLHPPGCERAENARGWRDYPGGYRWNPALLDLIRRPKSSRLACARLRMTGWDIKQKSPNGLFRPGAPREITRKYTSTGRTPVLSRLHPTGCLCPPGYERAENARGWRDYPGGYRWNPALLELIRRPKSSRLACARLRMTGWDIKQKKPKWAFSSRCPQGDSNSRFSLERAASWSPRRWGHRGEILP